MGDLQVETKWPHGPVEVSDLEYSRITQEISNAYDITTSQTEPFWQGWVESFWFTCHRRSDTVGLVSDLMLHIVAEQQLPGRRRSTSSAYYRIQLLRQAPMGLKFIVGDCHHFRTISPDPLARVA